MKKLLIAMLALIPMLSQAQTFYYGKPATLTGKLLRIKSLHPNQEAFGGNQIALALDQQVNVDGEEGLVKTKLIQLVIVTHVILHFLSKKVNQYKSNVVSCLDTNSTPYYKGFVCC